LRSRGRGKVDPWEKKKTDQNCLDGKKAEFQVGRIDFEKKKCFLGRTTKLNLGRKA